MSKLIIWVAGRFNLHGHKRGKFILSPAHGNIYIFEGKEFAPEEFNAKYAEAMKVGASMSPQVRVVGVGVPADVPPVATITAAHEITAEEAEAVIARLAPGRLKKRTGPKPKEAAALEVA